MVTAGSLGAVAKRGITLHVEMNAKACQVINL